MLRRPAVALLLAGLGLVMLAPAAGAGTFVAEDSYELQAGDTFEGNLYAFGQKVTIRGTVDGDLVAAGEAVEVADTAVIRGDAWLAGQTVVIAGVVEGDARTAGFSARVTGDVEGEVLAAGYHVGAEDSSSVGGDFHGAGYQVALDGAIGEDAKVAASAVRLAGSVGGDVSLEVEPGESATPIMFWPGMPAVPGMAPGLDLADSARVGGDLDLTYVGAEPPALASAGVAGVIETTMRPSAAKAVEEDWLPKMLARFFALLAVGVFGILTLPRLTERVQRALADRPLPAAGWGCLTLVLVPVALGVITLTTVILVVALSPLPFELAPVVGLGGLAGSAVGFGGLMALWIGQAVAGLWLGRLALRQLGRSPDARWLPLVVGCFFVAVLAKLPAVGGVLSIVFAALGVGAVALLASGRGQPEEPPMESPAPA